MKENFIPLLDGWFYIRHIHLDDSKPTILFLHGLGESGLSFQEAFACPALQHYTLVVPDLLGYGRSSYVINQDYSMESQVNRLWDLVDYLGLTSFILVGHSFGGDLATLMAGSDEDNQIKALINIEGDLTPHDIFFTDQAVKAAAAGCFPRWFEQDFKEELVLKNWGSKRASARRYYASLQFCRPEAFLCNAQESYKWNQPVAGKPATELGEVYAGLKIPKAFCWGGDSLAKETQAYLAQANLVNKKFPTAGHWPMIDQADEFYTFLADFLIKLK